MSYRRFVDTKGLTKEQWVEQRRNGIGGSDVGAIAGINPWSSSFDIWKSKVTNEDKQFSEQSIERMYWGTVEEPLVCNRFTELTGIKLQKCNFILQSIEYPFMLANVDRMCVIPGEKIGFEAKVTEVYSAGDWEEGVPESYMLQIQHYMAVTGFTAWYIAVKIGNGKFKWQRIERDEELIEYIIQIEKAFWENHVVTKIPPVPSNTDTDRIKELFKISNGLSVPLPNTALDLIAKREQLKADKKALDDEIDKIENELKLSLGENEVGSVADYLVTWKPQSRTSLDSTRIKAERPDIFADYSTTTEFRKLDVKKAKKLK